MEKMKWKRLIIFAAAREKINDKNFYTRKNYRRPTPLGEDHEWAG